MKITHNKVGQNLNVVENAKSDKASKSDKAATAKGNVPVMPRAEQMAPKDVGASRVDLSPRAQEAKRIKELAMAAPDVDSAKVARFQKMIDEGTYKVDANKVSDKMVDAHMETAE